MSPACSVCGHVTGAAEDAVLKPAGPDGHRYLCCGNCGGGRIDPVPEAEALARHYDQGYFVAGGARGGYEHYDAEERLHRRTARRRLARVDRFVAEAGRGRLLVDVGAATGVLADEACRAGWDAVAVEHSAWAADRCRARGLRVVPDLADLGDLTGTVDAVTFFQSLEHLLEPAAHLSLAAELLRPGGVVVCETWDLASRTAQAAGASWQQLSAPSVLWALTPASGARLVRRAGLEPVSWRRSPKSVSLATVLGQLGGGLGSGGQTALRRIRPATTRVPVPYPLDDLVTFVARRAG